MCIRDSLLQGKDGLSLIVARTGQLHHQSGIGPSIILQREGQHQAHNVSGGEIAGNGGLKVPAHLLFGQFNGVFYPIAQPVIQSRRIGNDAA